MFAHRIEATKESRFWEYAQNYFDTSIINYVVQLLMMFVKIINMYTCSHIRSSKLSLYDSKYQVAGFIYANYNTVLFALDVSILHKKKNRMVNKVIDINTPKSTWIKSYESKILLLDANHIHNIVQIHFAGLAVLCGIFLKFNLNMGIFHIILLIPENIVMDLNNVMFLNHCLLWNKELANI